MVYYKYFITGYAHSLSENFKQVFTHHHINDRVHKNRVHKNQTQGQSRDVLL
jgi:hypothetical protein